MTATVYSGAPIPSVGPAVATVPNYAVRRAFALVVVVAVFAVTILTLVSVVGAVVDFGGRPAAASEIEPAGTASSAAPIVRVHVAQSGDTLWSIADAYRGEVGRDRFIDALIDLNGGTGIQAGQAIRLP